ncbi:MAG: phosphatase [Ruminococcus sp.]|nr:phosphatase [Ruminococcus sp.]
MKLQADLHTHTIASTHAYSTITENCEWAGKYGLKAIAMTDHAMKMPDSPHIWHFANLGIIPRKINGVTVLKGIEANIINTDGQLDVDDWLLRQLEWVVASMHGEVMQTDTIENITKTYIKLCQNPYIDVIGHCTSDLFYFDYDKGVKAFKEYEKLIEINESSIINKKGSRENCYEILKLCKKYEVPVVVDSDSHFCQNIGQIPNALQIIEELDFPEKLVINTDWEKLREFIFKKRKNLDI